MTQTTKTKAFGYLRTSSATNVGADKDSDKRQMLAISEYAERAGIEIVDWFYDADVKGADSIHTRPAFAAMLEAILGNGVRTIIVETANRFSRDLITQETGWQMLTKLGITLIAADSPDVFVDDTPTATLIRQVLGAVAQFEKAALVAKLKGARDRKKATGVKVEGKKNYSETVPATVERAKSLRDEGLTLRAIADKLAEEGMLSEKGNTYAPSSIKNMLATASVAAPIADAPVAAAPAVALDQYGWPELEPWWLDWESVTLLHKNIESDEEIDAWLRERGLLDSGTCKEEDLGDAAQFFFEDPTTAVHFKLRFG